MRYVKGDATRPEIGEDELGILCHCCNDEGGWGSGFVLAINKRWSLPKQAYKAWHQQGETKHHVWKGQQGGNTLPFSLGQVQYVEVESNLWVANIIGQHKTINSGSTSPIRYDALEEGLRDVADACKALEKEGQAATVHMPRIGAGLARGKWEVIEEIIQRVLCDEGISVTVYDLP